MPRNRVVLETDGPFGKYRERALTPPDVGDAIVLIADIWKANRDDVRNQVEMNQNEIWRSAGYEVHRVP
jgi:TatD DNase family protein